MSNNTGSPFVGIVGLLLILSIGVGLLIITVLSILLPVFVYRIHGRARDINQELERLNQKFDTLLTVVRTVAVAAVPSLQEQIQGVTLGAPIVEFVDGRNRALARASYGVSNPSS